MHYDIRYAHFETESWCSQSRTNRTVCAGPARWTHQSLLNLIQPQQIQKACPQCLAQLPHHRATYFFIMQQFLLYLVHHLAVKGHHTCHLVIPVCLPSLMTNQYMTTTTPLNLHMDVFFMVPLAQWVPVWQQWQTCRWPAIQYRLWISWLYAVCTSDLSFYLISGNIYLITVTM